MNDKERATWKKYKIPNCSAMFNRKVNDFKFSKSNTMEHERKKFELAFEIFKNGGKFVMEAERVLKDGNDRRRIVDVVDLGTGLEFEVETSFVRALRFLGEKGVVVIPVGWSERDLKRWEDGGKIKI